jgi:hypothetical protein
MVTEVSQPLEVARQILLDACTSKGEKRAAVVDCTAAIHPNNDTDAMARLFSIATAHGGLSEDEAHRAIAEGSARAKQHVNGSAHPPLLREPPPPTSPDDYGGSLRKAVPPIKWLDMSRWDSEPIPERQWGIHNRVPLNQAGLFSGEGGTGKSIIGRCPRRGQRLARLAAGTGTGVLYRCRRRGLRNPYPPRRHREALRGHIR